MTNRDGIAQGANSSSSAKVEPGKNFSNSDRQSKISGGGRSVRLPLRSKDVTYKITLSAPGSPDQQREITRRDLPKVPANTNDGILIKKALYECMDSVSGSGYAFYDHRQKPWKTVVLHKAPTKEFFRDSAAGSICIALRFTDDTITVQFQTAEQFLGETL